MDQTRGVLRSAQSFFLGTLLSRFGGMLRDMATAACVGSGAEVSCFFVAFRIAHLFRRWIGEGTFQVGFTPHFEKLRSESEESARAFFCDSFWTLMVAVLGLVLLGEGLLAGARSWGGRVEEVARLAMWMLPGLIPIAMYSIGSALLQCERRYFLPAAAPALFNCVWIVAAVCLRGWPLSVRVEGLAIAVVGALLAQGLLPMGPSMRLMGRRFWSGQVFSKEARAIFVPLSLGAVGVGAMQLNGLLDSLFALYADGSGPAHLWYAIRIQQLPVGLVGVAMAGALLPPLSRAVAEGDGHRFEELMRGTLQSGLSLMVPCMVGLFMLGGVGVNLLYGRGAFTEADLQGTVACLWGYAVGLLPSLLVLLGSQGFYAQKDYRRPMWGALVAVGLNAGLNALFVLGLKWGAESVAYATSLSAFVNAAILFGDRLRWIPWKPLVRVAAVAVVAAVVTGGVGIWLEMPIRMGFPRNLGAQALQCAVGAMVFGGVVVGTLRREVIRALYLGK